MVAVVGAGAAGLCAGRHLIAQGDKFEFDIFEQQDEVGGTWRYSPLVGADQYGLPVHSSMYTNLRTNLPKEVMAFPDFPFEECGGRSFVHHTQVQEYLRDYALHHRLHTRIKFRKLVECVRPLSPEDEGTRWEVSCSDVITREEETRTYDAVMVCNGHYSVPYIPEIKGLDDFEGVVMHSHDYREPNRFRDLRVVVLGAGASGIDIAIEVAGFAKEVVLSHNTPPKTCPLPANLRQRAGFESVDPLGVTFLDGGGRYACDALLLCTGYLYHYPFLHPDCGIHIGDQKVSPLYLHMFSINHPTLAIWAVPKLIVPFPIYDQQCKLFLRFLEGVVQLPSRDAMRAEMEADFQSRLGRGLKPRHAHVMRGQLQWDLDDALARVGGIDPIPEVVRNLFKHVHQVRTLDVIRYKEDNYRLVDDKTFEQID